MKKGDIARSCGLAVSTQFDTAGWKILHIFIFSLLTYAQKSKRACAAFSVGNTAARLCRR
jgi:hypothetical protein